MFGLKNAKLTRLQVNQQNRLLTVMVAPRDNFKGRSFTAAASKEMVRMEENHGRKITERGMRMLFKMHVLLSAFYALMIELLALLGVNAAIVGTIITWTILMGRLKRVWGRTFPKKCKKKRR